MDRRAAMSAFNELVADCDAASRPVPLDTACLLISAVFDARVDVTTYLSRLDAFAERAAATAAGPSSYAIIGSLHHLLFTVLGCHGNERTYDDPSNGLLSTAIDRYTGLPITLGILLMEVSRRVGLPLQGVGLPGHFVVRFPDPESRLYIDAFHGGRILGVAECAALVDRIYHGRVTWRDDFLSPLDERAILKRVLLNLKNAFNTAKDYPGALAAVALRMTLDPGDATELRDRGILFARLRRYDRAIADLEAYLERSPHAGDSDHIRTTVQYLRQERHLLP